MNIKEDLFDMFRQISEDYASSIVPRSATNDDEIEIENKHWIEVLDAYQEGSKNVVEFVMKNYNISPKEKDDKYCQCQEPDRDNGYTYCQRCHKHVSDSRMRFLVHRDEMFCVTVKDDPDEIRRKIDYNNLCARATLYPGKTIDEVLQLQLVDRIEDTHKHINALLLNTTPMNTEKTRKYVADIIQKRLNHDVIVKCNEENNSPEIIDMNLLVAELYWNVPYDAKTPQVQHSILVFGTDEQIGKYQKQYLLDNELFKFIGKGL